MKTKRWYLSKTVWLNIITAVASVLMLLAHDPYWAGQAMYLLMGSSVLNALLRVITDTEIEK
jgi:hypothetical protein